METKLCVICSGLGSLSCWMCEDTGQMSDKSIFVKMQKGDKTCIRCSGQSTLQCSNCDGQGIVPVSEDIKCQYCDEKKSVPCFWCEGTGVLSIRRNRIKKACVHCQGTGNRKCPDCGGSGTITAELKSAPLEEWRRRLSADFERAMLTALSDWINEKQRASDWNETFTVSSPSLNCIPYGLIDNFGDRLRAEDPNGLDAAYEDTNHPYMFFVRCGTLWDHYWHDLGLPDFGWPESVQEMLDAGTPDKDYLR